MTNNLEKLLEECGKNISSLSDDELFEFFFCCEEKSIIAKLKKEIVKNLPYNSKFAKKIAIWDKNSEVIKECILKIDDQKWLTEKAIADANINCKLVAISKIVSEENLKDLLRYEHMPNIAIRNIVKKINTQSLLEELFLSEKVSDIAKLYISDKLENKEFLEDISKDESKDENIRLLALDRLKEL